jgi:hypothetical protein
MNARGVAYLRLDQIDGMRVLMRDKGLGVDFAEEV